MNGLTAKSLAKISMIPALSLAAPLLSADIAGADPATIPDIEPDMKTKVYIFQSEPDSAAATLSDCSGLSAMLAWQLSPLIQLSEVVSPAIRQFSSEWLAAGGTLATQTGDTLAVIPTATTRLELLSIEVASEDWRLNPSLDGRDITAAVTESTCTVAAAVDYLAEDLLVEIADSVTFWVSDEAAQNQADYDNETIEIFKTLYGDDGLGFGDYAKGGIAFRHKPPVPGAGWSYNEFSLHWRVREADIATRAAELIPGDLPASPITGWADSCQPVTLRIADNPEFIAASSKIINRLDLCNEKPLFIPVDGEPIPDNTTAAFLAYLHNADRLHHLAFSLDDQGHVIPCDERDPISFDGCSQPIVASFQPLLKSFYKGLTDLYAEVVFSQKVKKVFYLDAFSGTIEEVESHIIDP